MRRTQAGITLLELLVVVSIVGILAAIAYPNYRQYALRGNRTEGKAELMEASQELEKCFTRYGAYNDGNCNVYVQLQGAGRPSEGSRYQISLQAGTTATDYVLQAVPQGGQQADTVCGTLTLDQSGRRGAATTDPKCW